MIFKGRIKNIMTIYAIVFLLITLYVIRQGEQQNMFHHNIAIEFWNDAIIGIIIKLVILLIIGLIAITIVNKSKIKK